MAEPQQPVFLLLADDLMWTSRIIATGQAHGVRVRVARTVERLEAMVREQPTRCVILDLGLKGLASSPPCEGGVGAVAELIGRIRAATSGPVRFTAYGSHVDVATLKAARDAGCEPVLARSQMADQMDQWMEEWQR